MASTLDSSVKQIQSDLKLSTTKVVRTVVRDILKGKKIDPNIITDAANTVINKAMGGILNKATQQVNQTIAKALGKKFKNSSLNVIAGNYAASIVTSIVTGRKMPDITTQMTNSISQGISRELYAKLPKSITKSMNINVLGTTFNVGLSPYIGKAINDTVKAVVTSMTTTNTKTSAASFTIPGLNIPVSIPTITFTKPDFSALQTSITTGFDTIKNSITGLVDQLGSAANTVISSISSLKDINIKEVKLPEGIDMSRFSSSNPAIGKLIEMSSAPIGSITGVAGLAKDQFMNIQKQLVTTNIENPLGKLGGAFSNLSTSILGTTTSSGIRSITKDLTQNFNDINNAFGVKSDADKKADSALKTATTEINKKVASQATEEAKTFKTFTTDQLEKIVNTKEGFKDPNAKYPLPEYANRSETNKLATGDTSDTIVDKKNSERMLGAQLPNGASWDQPVSPYNAQYPYNHVTETESGHTIELDDTPGAERIHVMHKTGTSIEVDALGNKVSIIKGSDYTIIDKNGYISIQGKANVSINGSCNVFIGSDANIEVNGNTTVTCHNNIEMNAAGRLKLTAGEGIDIKSPSIYMDADTDLQINADVNARIHTKDFNLIVDTDMKVDVKNDIRMSSIGDMNVKVGGDQITSVTGSINTTATKDILNKCANHGITTTGDAVSVIGGEISLHAGGNVAMDGAEVHMNSGVSKSSVTQPTIAKPADALETEYSDANYIKGRKSRNETPIIDSFVKTQSASKVASKVIDMAQTTSTSLSDKQKAEIVEDHDVSPEVIDKKPIILEEAKPVETNVPIILPEKIPLDNVEFPSNFKLSPYVTIGSLTTHTTNPGKLAPAADLMTLPEIVSNLQYIALNIIEPIYAMRRDMIVDTCFLPIGEDKTKFKRHNFGLSVALDFKNANSFDDYYDLADLIRQTIPFSEMILIYMSADFAKTPTDTGLIVINIPGVAYPNITKLDIADARKIETWIDQHNTKKLKTWFNGKIVNENNLARIA